MGLRQLTSVEQAVLSDALAKYEVHLNPLADGHHPKEKEIKNTVGVVRILRSYANDRNSTFSITTP